jgi:hypothetical protein
MGGNELLQHSAIYLGIYNFVQNQLDIAVSQVSSPVVRPTLQEPSSSN